MLFTATLLLLFFLRILSSIQHHCYKLPKWERPLGLDRRICRPNRPKWEASRRSTDMNKNKTNEVEKNRKFKTNIYTWTSNAICATLERSRAGLALEVYSSKRSLPLSISSLDSSSLCTPLHGYMRASMPVVALIYLPTSCGRVAASEALFCGESSTWSCISSRHMCATRLG